MTIQAPPNTPSQDLVEDIQLAEAETIRGQLRAVNAPEQTTAPIAADPLERAVPARPRLNRRRRRRSGPDPTPDPPLDHRTIQRSIPARGAPPGRYLTVEIAGELRLIPLQRPITHIGRGLISDVRLEDPHVSRRHAIVALRGDGVRVLDDRSANGTFRNGQRVSIAYLADGDVLRFGSTVLRYMEITRPVRARPQRKIARDQLKRGPLAHSGTWPYTAPVSQ